MDCRRRYPRLTSFFCGRDDIPPHCLKKSQPHPDPTKRPDSLSLPTYQRLRKPVNEMREKDFGEARDGKGS